MVLNSVRKVINMKLSIYLQVMRVTKKGRMINIAIIRPFFMGYKLFPSFAWINCGIIFARFAACGVPIVGGSQLAAVLKPGTLTKFFTGSDEG